MSLLQGSWLIAPYTVPGFCDLAEILEITLRENDEDQIVRQVYASCGADKILAYNIGIVRRRLRLQSDIPPKRILDVLEKFALLNAQPLRTVRGPTETQTPRVTALICGGSVPEMEARIKEALKQHRAGKIFIERFVGLTTTRRLCNAPDEHTSASLKKFSRCAVSQPTEAQMLHALFDSLPCGFIQQIVTSSRVSTPEALAKQFARKYSPEAVYVPTAAGAQYLALMVRRCLRSVWGMDFDRDDNSSLSLFTSNTARALATEGGQCEQPYRFVHPLALPSGVARFALELSLANKG